MQLIRSGLPSDTLNDTINRGIPTQQIIIFPSLSDLSPAQEVHL